MHRIRPLGLVVVAVTTIITSAVPAAANCIGPGVQFDASAPVDRGTSISISGTGFGDECYDTGPPPAGQGVLGNPLTGIEIFLVQSDDSFLVGAGAADDEYVFDVDITVPAGLQPGEATLSVVAPEVGEVLFPNGESVVVVSDAPPIDSDLAEAQVVTFGPDAEPVVVTPASPAGSNADRAPEPPSAVLLDDDNDNSFLLLGVGLGILMAGALLAVFAWSRVRRTTEQS